MTRLLVVVILLALALNGCSAPAQTPLTVFAAASLRNPVTELAERHTQRTGREVRLSFAGSADLVAQLEQGAPVDLLITADEPTMDRVDQLLTDRRVVATNTLVLVAQSGNPLGLTGAVDLGRTDLQLVVCAPQVPCGRATARLAELNQVALHPVSEENSVTDVVGKVASGAADAGVVYATDAAAHPDLATVELARADEVVNRYPAAVVSGSPQAAAARDLLALVDSDEGHQVLAEAGFGRP